MINNYSLLGSRSKRTAHGSNTLIQSGRGLNYTQTGQSRNQKWTVSNRKTGPLDTLDLDEKTESRVCHVGQNRQQISVA